MVGEVGAARAGDGTADDGEVRASGDGGMAWNDWRRNVAATAGADRFKPDPEPPLPPPAIKT